MRTLLIATVAVLGCSAMAHAGEGNGEPFPAPDTGVTTQVQTPNYTMGSTAPFNYFVPGASSTLQGYVQAPGSNQDPYPYKTVGRTITLRPAAPTAIARSPGLNAANHG